VASLHVRPRLVCGTYTAAHEVDGPTTADSRLRAERPLRAIDFAEECECAVRTIYRDIEALSAAGVPVAAQSGEGYRINCAASSAAHRLHRRGGRAVDAGNRCVTSAPRNTRMRGAPRSPSWKRRSRTRRRPRSLDCRSACVRNPGRGDRPRRGLGPLPQATLEDRVVQLRTTPSAATK